MGRQLREMRPPTRKFVPNAGTIVPCTGKIVSTTLFSHGVFITMRREGFDRKVLEKIWGVFRGGMRAHR